MIIIDDSCICKKDMTLMIIDFFISPTKQIIQPFFQEFRHRTHFNEDWVKFSISTGKAKNFKKVGLSHWIANIPQMMTPGEMGLHFEEATYIERAGTKYFGT